VAWPAARVIADLPKLYIWTGWIAFLIFIPLAVTSMGHFVRRMGPSWKTLQRTTYTAAVLTLVHWRYWKHTAFGIGICGREIQPSMAYVNKRMVQKIREMPYWAGACPLQKRKF